MCTQGELARYRVPYELNASYIQQHLSNHYQRLVKLLWPVTRTALLSSACQLDTLQRSKLQPFLVKLAETY
jgi:hypothetical protein